MCNNDVAKAVTAFGIAFLQNIRIYIYPDIYLETVYYDCPPARRHCITAKDKVMLKI